MRLDVDRERHLLGEALPAFEHAHGVGRLARAQIGLDVDVMHTERRAPFERRLQTVDIVWEAQPLDDKTALGREARRLPRLPGIDPQRSDAVEAGVGDPGNLPVERLVGLAAQSGHGPQRLQDEELLHAPVLESRVASG